MNKLKSFILLLFLFISLFSYGDEFSGTYEEGYIEIIVNKKIEYDFFPIYMDYSLEEPYVGVLNFFSLIMAGDITIDGARKIIYGKIGEKDFNFDYSNSKYIYGENDIFIRGSDLSALLGLEKYEWNTETYTMKIKTSFETPYELYMEHQKRISKLGEGDEEKIDANEIYTNDRKFFSLGAITPRYVNTNIENSEGHFSVKYDTQLLYGDFTTTGFIYPDASLGYTALKYNEILEDKTIIVGDAYMQTYSFLGSKTLTGIGIQEWNGTTSIDVGRTTIRGFADYGSQVELYRNRSLYKFTRARKDGTYIFENINVQSYGDIYTVKIYNSDGSIDIRQVSIETDRKILKKGEYDYGFLVGGDRYKDNNNIDYSNSKDVEGNIKGSYGLTDKFTFELEYVNDLTGIRSGNIEYNYPLEIAGLNLYYTTGAVKYPTYFEFFEIYDIENIPNSSNQNTHIGKVKQKLGPNYLTVEGFMYSDFFAFKEKYENRYLTYWDGYINQLWGYNLGYDYIDRGSFNNQIGSASIYRNTDDVSHELGIAYPLNEFSGTTKMYYSYSNSGWSIRDQNLNFMLRLNSDVETYDKNSDVKISVRTSGNEKLKLGMYATYNTKEEYTVGLEGSYKLYNWIEILSGILYREPGGESHFIGVDIEKTIILEKPLTKNTNPDSNRSWMSGKVYMDENNNGIQDEGEPFLEDIELKVGRKTSVTNEKGEYFIDDIRPYQVEDFEINTETMDPMLRGGNKKKFVKLYPASGGVIDIPIQTISVIMGSILIDGEPISAVDNFPIISQLYINLRDLDGNIILNKRIEPEGFYLLDEVLPGSYILEIEYIGEGDLKFENSSIPIDINSGSYGDYYEDLDFKIIGSDGVIIRKNSNNDMSNSEIEAQAKSELINTPQSKAEFYSKEKDILYTVRAGDTLADIARKFGTTPLFIHDYNNRTKNIDTIWVGEILKIKNS